MKGWVRVFRGEYWRASLLRQRLEARGIPAVAFRHEGRDRPGWATSMVDPPYVVLVPRAQREGALAVLEESDEDGATPSPRRGRQPKAASGGGTQPESWMGWAMFVVIGLVLLTFLFA